MTLYWLVMRALHQHTPTGRGETKLRARASRVRPKCGPTFCTFSPRVSLYGLQLETANMPGDHINERSCAIRDVVARDLRGASTETTGLFTHVLPQAVLARPRAGITPDVTAPTRVGMPAQAAGAAPQPPRYTMMDVI